MKNHIPDALIAQAVSVPASPAVYACGIPLGTAFKLLYSIFLCLSRHRYIFEGDIFLDEQIDRVRLSLDHLLRANPYGTIIQRLKQSVYKDYMNIKLTILLESASPQFIRTPNQRLWCRASCGGC